MPSKPGDKQESAPAAELRVFHSPALERAVKECPLLKGDKEAWLQCCTKQFMRLAARIAGGNAQAQDALQKSWIRVWQHVEEYDGKSPACAWVHAIVVNCAHDVRNEETRMAQMPEPAPDPEDAAAIFPEDFARQKELYRLLDAAVKELPEIYRQVVELHYGKEELSMHQTADRLHISDAAAAKRLTRAVKMLRSSLAKRLRGDSSKPPSNGKPLP